MSNTPPASSGSVPMTATPLSVASALAVLDEAMPPGHTREGLNLVAAQSALETSWWGSRDGKGFYNFNFGNVTPLGTQPYWSTPSIKGMRYRSFSNAPAGAAAFVGWLASHGALMAASAGDVAGYMAALKKGCYLGCIGRTDPSTGKPITEADYDAYQAGIESIMATLAKVTPLPAAGVA